MAAEPERDAGSLSARPSARKPPAFVAGMRGSVTRSETASSSIATPMIANTSRQSNAFDSMTPTGTPATVASETPPDVNMSARPSLVGPTSDDAALIDIDQNVESAAPSMNRAMRISQNDGATATSRFDAAPSSAIQMSRARRSMRGKTLPTRSAVMRPANAVMLTV